MSSMGMRRFAFIALVVVGIFVLGLGWPDRGSRDVDVAGSVSNSRADMSSDSRRNPSPHGSEARDSIPSTPTAAEARRPPSRVPMRLEVHAPSDARLGETFQARVDIDANVSVRDLVFSVTYERSRLRLVGRSEGEFVRQPGVPAEFGVDEPSDGNVLIVYNARDGLSASGAGTIVVFEFEAIGRGTSEVAVLDVRVNDIDGGGNREIAITGERVTIH
jgi:hypothetical protein